MDERKEFRAWCESLTESDWLIAQSFEESFFLGAWAAWRHLRTALAAATERAEALHRIVTDFAEATGWVACEYPPASDIECERCNKAGRQLYYRGTSSEVDEGDSWCAECVCIEPIDAMVSAMQRADALAKSLQYETEAHDATRRKLRSAEGCERLFKEAAEAAEAKLARACGCEWGPDEDLRPCAYHAEQSGRDEARVSRAKARAQTAKRERDAANARADALAARLAEVEDREHPQ